MITAASLRATFAEFKVTATYPDSSINFWITVAYKLLNPQRWGCELDLAASLFVAHQIVLEARARKAAATGGTPGIAKGAITSAGADKASVGYDANITSLEGYGNWNLTDYGTRLAFLIDCYGAGPVQVGAGLNFSGVVIPGSDGGYGPEWG